MWSHFLTFVNKLNVLMLWMFAVFLQLFGFYVLAKKFRHQNDQETSFLAIFSVVFSFILLLTLTLKSNRNRIISHSGLLSFCASTILIARYESKRFQEFFSHEISILWTLKDSSMMYQNTIELIQYLVDCCKVHTIVSNFLKEDLLEIYGKILKFFSTYDSV
jgi:predicted neutral ceramidase superfamily lipid hydrolase